MIKILLILLILFFIIRAAGMYLNSRIPENGINESMYVDINGTRQWISIYGKDKDYPVLLYLHGGPGSSTSIYDYAFTRKWSDIYTVVTWDQRNCGKSCDKVQKDVRFTKELMMADGLEMTKFILDHLHKEKITLLGHSWGSMFGANLALEYPQYYDAFIGTGQCIDIRENEERLYNAAKEWAKGDEEGLKILEKMDLNNSMTLEYIQTRNQIMKRYHYDMMKDKTDYNMFTTILFNPYYLLKDYLSFILNYKSSLMPYLDFDFNVLPEFSLKGKYDYQIPYLNINGDIDYQTNYEMACEYFEKVNAPFKKMYVMKNATHGLLESRSQEFSEILHEVRKDLKEHLS